MRLAVVALAIVAMLSPLNAAASGKAGRDARDYGLRILTTPSSGDEARFGAVFQQNAQQISDKMFGALAKTLGGSAPTVALVPSVAGGGEFFGSATPAANRINLTPSALLSLIVPSDNFHDSAVNGMPHEMAHLRQTAPVYADTTQREGGAQAFADIVAPLAAAAAHTPYASTPGAYDGSYAPLVQAVMAQKGRDWVLGGQFGRTAPPNWP